MTSKEGLSALDKKGVTLHVHRSSFSDKGTYTSVMHQNRVVGTIDHPSGADRHFSVNSSRAHMDTRGEYTQSHDLGKVATHDRAIEKVLQDHGIESPKLTAADRLASSVVSGPRSSSVVHGPHIGKKAAPEKGMSDTARNADSVATRIRMNAPRTNPLTGEKLTSSTRSADKIAAQVNNKGVTTSRLKSMYGKLLTLHRSRTGKADTIDRHLSALSMSPESHHQLVSEYMGEKSGGIHLGNKRAIDMKGSATEIYHANGIPILHDRKDENIGGVYFGNHRQLVVPEDTGLSGSVSTASHEFAHALDAAYGKKLSGKDTPASQLPHFQQVYREVSHMHDNSKTVLNPYYTDKSTGVGSKEMWAEGYAAWLHGRQRYRTPDEQAMLIGHEIGAAPSEKLRVGRVLKNYFDIQDEKIRDLTR